MKRILYIVILTFILINSTLKAQILHPVKWSYAAKKLNNKDVVLLLKATIDDTWHIYSVNLKDGGPVKTSFVFTQDKNYTLVGKTTEPKPVTVREKSFGMDVSYFEHEVIFRQKIKLEQGGKPITIKGSLDFMVCNNQKCLPPEDVTFSVPVK